MAGDVAGHFDARHEAKRRCAGAHGGDLGGAGSLAKLDSALARVNRRWKRILDDAAAPDANEEYLFYQTLLGTWPMDAAGQAEKTASPEYIAAFRHYMAKALKEAKLNTSWIQPNEQWDAAMNEFVGRVLDPSPKNKFLPSFLPGRRRDRADSARSTRSLRWS